MDNLKGSLKRMTWSMVGLKREYIWLMIQLGCRQERSCLQEA
jgi:hypothetical protein